jgi:predicted secreted Zn-dependent protease
MEVLTFVQSVPKKFPSVRVKDTVYKTSYTIQKASNRHKLYDNVWNRDYRRFDGTCCLVFSEKTSTVSKS